MGIYFETNEFLEQCFHRLESAIPPPTVVETGGEKALRYKEENLEHAAIQKLARYISGLNAALLLLEQGFVQEVGSIFRMLDEFQEDILFLCLPIVGAERSKLHDEYLQYFYQQKFDNPNNAILSKQNRPTVPRKKIISYIASTGMSGLNPHDSLELSRTLRQAYSGYVHGASEHILEMVGGTPPKYSLSGMPGTVRQQDFYYNYWDYLYRGINATALVAKALGSATVVDVCSRYRNHFESVTGDTGHGDAEKLMKKTKRKKV